VATPEQSGGKVANTHTSAYPHSTSGSMHTSRALPPSNVVPHPEPLPTWTAVATSTLNSSTLGEGNTLTEPGDFVFGSQSSSHSQSSLRRPPPATGEKEGDVSLTAYGLGVREIPLNPWHVDTSAAGGADKDGGSLQGGSEGSLSVHGPADTSGRRLPANPLLVPPHSPLRAMSPRWTPVDSPSRGSSGFSTMALDGRGDDDEQLPIRRLDILPHPRQNTEEPHNAVDASENGGGFAITSEVQQDTEAIQAPSAEANEHKTIERHPTEGAGNFVFDHVGTEDQRTMHDDPTVLSDCIVKGQ
jgi:hypothetical protein